MDMMRYDRQVRLWGDEGQHSIQKSSVCMLGSSALATEILKNMVLPGVGRFCVIDDALVEATDLGQNFFLTADDVGRSRAAAVTKYLSELNPSVEGEYFTGNPRTLSDQQLSNLLNFSIVISTGLTEDHAKKLGNFLYANNVYFIYTRICGMFGYLRLCFRSHSIWNIHAEHSSHDFRLDAPPQELLEMADEQDLDAMNHERHSHTPYLLLYVKALRKMHETDPTFYPNTYQKRKEFTEVLMRMRVPNEMGVVDEENFDEAKRNLLRSFPVKKIPDHVARVLDDRRAWSLDSVNELPKTSGSFEHMELMCPFWIFAAALQRFVELHDGQLPLSGQLPDMTSDSARYVQIQKIYRKMASEHANEVFDYAQHIVRERRKLLAQLCADKPEPVELSFAQCREFCRNASRISVQNGVSITEEYDHTTIAKVLKQIEPCDLEKQPVEVSPLVWFVAMRGMDRFHKEKGRFPGTNGVPCIIDARDLRRRIIGLIQEAGRDDLIKSDEALERLIPSGVVDEICRYGAAEPHPIAAMMGGVIAQEAIKLLTNQYLPLDNALIFDGHSQRAASFRVV